MNSKTALTGGHTLVYSIILFFLAACFYTLMNYGGIRSPDSEIVYRQGESIIEGRGLAVEEIETWPGFGLATGKDGKKYPVFGPAESFFAQPFYWLARQLDKTGWYKRLSYLPPSHYYSDGLYAFAADRQAYDPAQHARRTVVSFFNVLVSTCAVLVFWFIMLRLLGDVTAAFISALLFGFGTLAWPYATTFFSEPLATLFVLLSFHRLIRVVTAVCPERPDNQPLPENNYKVYRDVFASAIFLGLAVSTHLTALLFVPFFAACILFPGMDNTRQPLLHVPLAPHAPQPAPLPAQPAPLKAPAIAGKRKRLPALVFFLVGLAFSLVPLLIYNFYRFGSIFETGRTVDPSLKEQFYYGTFSFSLQHLYGLLFGSGKGLLLYAPIIILGLLGWYYFHKQRPALSYIFMAMAACRVLFIASRSDWHGGFSLGPRYLVMLIPFLVIPAGYAWRQFLSQKKIRYLWLSAIYAFFCISQQVYFCTGEIFSFFHAVKWQKAAEGIDILKHDRVYLDWEFSPIYHLLKGKRGPFLLHGSGISNGPLWLLLTLLTGITLAAVLFFLILKRGKRGNL